MKKILILLIPLAFLFLSCNSPRYKKACFNNSCVKLEVADTERERQGGLMFKGSLPKDNGLLFVFKEEGLYSFWMKNMRFPLDIIWISEDKKVVDIKENVPPCGSACEGLLPAAKARYVLEVNSGFAAEQGIKIGDRVKLFLFDLG